MEKRDLVFNRVKWMKDHWVDTVMSRLISGEDLESSDIPEQYQLLQASIRNKQDAEALKLILNETIVSFMHTFFVMLDNGDRLADSFIVDLIDGETGESIIGDRAYHEEFIAYIGDNE